MKDNELLRTCLTACMCIAAVLAGCSDPNGGAGAQIAPPSDEVVAAYQRCLTQEDMAGVSGMVDEEVQDQCLELILACGRYEQTGQRLAKLVRSQYGEELATAFLEGPFGMFRRLAVQSMFFVLNEKDNPIYAGPVALVPKDGGWMLTVAGKSTNYFLRHDGTDWKVSRLAGNERWRLSMETVAMQLDALGQLFQRISEDIEGPEQLAEPYLSSLLMLRCQPSKSQP